MALKQLTWTVKHAGISAGSNGRKRLSESSKALSFSNLAELDEHCSSQVCALPRITCGRGTPSRLMLPGLSPPHRHRNA